MPDTLTDAQSLLPEVTLVSGLLMAVLLALSVYLYQTARFRAEALRESEARFRDLYDEAPVGLATTRSIRKVVSAGSTEPPKPCSATPNRRCWGDTRGSLSSSRRRLVGRSRKNSQGLNPLDHMGEPGGEKTAP